MRDLGRGHLAREQQGKGTQESCSPLIFITPEETDVASLPEMSTAVEGTKRELTHYTDVWWITIVYGHSCKSSERKVMNRLSGRKD